jgi:hypothetical protein
MPPPSDGDELLLMTEPEILNVDIAVGAGGST